MIVDNLSSFSSSISIHCFGLQNIPKQNFFKKFQQYHNVETKSDHYFFIKGSH